MGKTPERAAGGVSSALLQRARDMLGTRMEIFRPLGVTGLFFALVAFSFGQANTEALGQKVVNGTVEQKRDALLQIRNLRTEEASRAAIPALHDPSEMVRATAAASVVFLPKTEAIAALMPLLKDKAPFVRKEAAYAIGNVGDPSTMLGEEKDGEIASALRLLLEKDPDLEVRSAAAVAMGNAGGLQSVWYLFFYLQSAPKNEANEFIRRSAVRSIGTVAERLRSGPDALPAVRRDPLREKYQHLDFSEEFRSFSSSSRLLIDILQNRSESDDMRREAAKALGNIGVLAAEPVLSANLNAGDPYLVNICKEALEKLKSIKSP